ncbi:MAG: gamma-glutamyltransferase, partial [Nitrososphaerota archaeon]|nr:gamma-glutamyltransferase [Nitrososphaerota archaeon]
MTLSRTALFEHAAIASEQPLASLAGYQALKDGGNAFDAAAATAFVLAVTFHPAGGLGGDFFSMSYESRTGKVHCLNSSGWSPSGLTSGLVQSRGEGGVPLFGPTSVVVPGFVAGVLELQEKFGRLETKGLLAP